MEKGDSADILGDQTKTVLTTDSGGDGTHMVTLTEAIVTSEDGMISVATDAGTVLAEAAGAAGVAGVLGEAVALEGQEAVVGSELELGQVALHPTHTVAAEQVQTEVEASVAGGGMEPSLHNIIIQHMNITEPLSTLRKLLEARLSCSLEDHVFMLQDNLELDPMKNLVEQCVQGEGTVQINVEVKSQPGQRSKINIVDILKLAEDTEPQQPPVQASEAAAPEQVTRWIVDQNFRREQDRLKIPYDPIDWNEAHVRHWIEWGIKEFSLEGVNPDAFTFGGDQLRDMQHSDFVKLVPEDKGDVFWTHLELLRKCKFVAVVQQPTPMAVNTVTVASANSHMYHQGYNMAGKVPKVRTSRIIGDGIGSTGNRTGNNGQIQLWQFLLELLTDKSAREYIQWQGEDGDFKLLHPENVAQLWGERKHKPTMNYEKLSRALRYYYDGDMIAKVHGKRFVYKFVCDLKALLGYTAGELNQLVEASAVQELNKVRENLRPGLVRKQCLVPGVDPKVEDEAQTATENATYL